MRGRIRIGLRLGSDQRWGGVDGGGVAGWRGGGVAGWSGAAHLGCAACGVGTAPLATKGALATLKVVDTCAHGT